MSLRAIAAAVVLVIAGVSVPAEAQEPDSAGPSCYPGRLPATATFGRVTSNGPALVWYPWRVGRPGGCDPAANDCAKAPALRPGEPLELALTEGNWSCVYHNGPTGGGLVWIDKRFVTPIPVNRTPRHEQWIGWWRSLSDPYERVLIAQNKDHRGTLSISGRSRWQGNAGVVHFGQFKGTVESGTNPLHVAESDCEVTLLMFGPYLKIADNGNCGGANVRFGGFWRKGDPPSNKTPVKSR